MFKQEKESGGEKNVPADRDMEREKNRQSERETEKEGEQK